MYVIYGNCATFLDHAWQIKDGYSYVHAWMLLHVGQVYVAVNLLGLQTHQG